VNRAKVSVLEEANEVCLGSLLKHNMPATFSATKSKCELRPLTDLQRSKPRGLPTEVRFSHVLGDLGDDSLERASADEILGALLVSPYFPEGDAAGPVALR
jgi:hypothetical protein